MVCSVGKGRMEALSRLLKAGSFTQILAPDDDNKQKQTANDLLSELSEANEANLLEEEDMHVFGLNPMDDPLYLVSCNFCKKPINASQYANHAELCKSLGLQEAYAKADDCNRYKKTPRKERKKLSRYPPHQAMTKGVRTKLKSTKVGDSVAPKIDKDDHIGAVSSLSTLTDDSLDGTPKREISSVNYGFEDHSTAIAPKRCKLMHARTMVKPSEQETQDARCNRYGDIQTCKESARATIGGHGKPHKEPLEHQETHKFSRCSSPKDFPAPLATKIYYPQRSNRLRSALSLMFHKTSETRTGCDLVSSEALERNLTLPEAFPTADEHRYEFSDLKEIDKGSLVSQPILGSRAGADVRQTANVSGLSAGHILRPHSSHEMLKSQNISQTHSFVDSSGTLVGII
uniref:SAGA-associated factor 11 n=1 Tax=Kalanchoe fedtschenkoi TaxID=63787 RepID=A0A7N1A1X7_KALFE